LNLVVMEKCRSIYFKQIPNVVFNLEHGTLDREMMIEQLPED